MACFSSCGLISARLEYSRSCSTGRARSGANRQVGRRFRHFDQRYTINLAADLAPAHDQSMYTLSKRKDFRRKLIIYISSRSTPANNSLFKTIRNRDIPNHQRCCRFCVEVNKKRVIGFAPANDIRDDSIVARRRDSDCVNGTSTKARINRLDTL